MRQLKELECNIILLIMIGAGTLMHEETRSPFTYFFLLRGFPTLAELRTVPTFVTMHTVYSAHLEILGFPMVGAY